MTCQDDLIDLREDVSQAEDRLRRKGALDEERLKDADPESPRHG